MKLRVMSAALLMGAASYAAFGGPAFAADLGGDCCADLEERVAELEATTARKGNRKVSLTVSGQVTQALMYWNDGHDSDTYVIDPTTSNSRFRFTGSAKISPALSAGFSIEIEGILSPSDKVTQADDDGGISGDGAMEMRLAYWYLSHKSLGKLSVGRLSMATDSVAQIDLGGANIVAQSGLYFGNDMQIRTTAGGNAGTFDSFAVGNFEFDRNNAVRYDSPTLGGFVVSASWGENDRWDATLRYAGEFSGFRLAAGIGYGVDTDELPAGGIDEKQVFIGSASILHVASGFFLSGSAGQQANELTAGGEFDETTWSVRGGLSKNWFGIGKTVLYGEYHNWDNGKNSGTVAEIWGAGLVQNIDAAAMELFLAYKNHSVDIPNTEETHLLISGARIRF